MAAPKEEKHFVLVHGACHGSWCWYKIKPRLESAGHRVTALDLAASGINTKAIQDVHSLAEYSEPLLEFIASLGPEEKVILVGHSLGGMSLALAMENFPQKISVAVFLTAFVPDTTHQPSHVLDQYNQNTPAEAWLDTQFTNYGSAEEPLMSMHFGPEFLAKLYQLSPIEIIPNKKMAATNEAQKAHAHFVLVHGAGHGAWCWYKIKPKLESSGHKVTVLNLTGSGINMKAIHDVHSLAEYSEPLLELIASLGPKEKVILVGHSLGGMNLSLAMERFPQKISAAVFLTAFLPDTTHQPSYVMDEFMQKIPADSWLDTQFEQFGSAKEPLTSIFFGPKYLQANLYQLSPIEDLELAKSLVRKSSFFREEVAKMKKFSNEGYGSVTRVYVVCDKDLIITEEFQRWMIANSGVKNVVEIKGADHMPMFSKPQELSNAFLEIAQKYA